MFRPVPALAFQGGGVRFTFSPGEKAGMRAVVIPSFSSKTAKNRVFARTDREMAAQMGKPPHGGTDDPHGTGDRPHGLKNRRTERKTPAQMGKSPHGNGNCPHGTKDRLREANFARTEPRFTRWQRIRTQS